MIPTWVEFPAQYVIANPSYVFIKIRAPITILFRPEYVLRYSTLLHFIVVKRAIFFHCKYISNVDCKYCVFIKCGLLDMHICAIMSLTTQMEKTSLDFSMYSSILVTPSMTASRKRSFSLGLTGICPANTYLTFIKTTNWQIFKC